MTLIKEDLAYLIRDLLDLDRHTFIRASKANHIVNIILDTITATLRSGQSVFIPGFGKFTLRRRLPLGRKCCYFYGRKNGPTLYRLSPSKLLVHFQPAKPLIRYLNNEEYVKSQS